MNSINKKQLSNILSLIILTVVLNVNAKSQVNLTVANSIYLRAYHQSIEMHDYTAAVNFLSYLCQNNPVKYNDWLDTLDLLYLKNKNYAQSFRLSDTLLVNKGVTDLRMEIKAESAKELHDNIQSLMSYTLLFNKTKKPIYGFEELRIEYNMQLFNEAITTANNLKTAVLLTKDSTEVEVVRDDGKTIQHVLLSAAVFNLSGQAFLELKKKSEAIHEFKIAIQLSPDFDFANKSLKLIQNNP